MSRLRCRRLVVAGRHLDRLCLQPPCLHRTPRRRPGHPGTRSVFLIDIYLMRADGTQVQRLTQAPGYDGGRSSARWPPDRLATLCAGRGHGRNLDHVPRRLAAAADHAPGRHVLGAVFSPVGAYIIFTNNAQGMGNELYMSTARAARAVRVTSTDGFDGLPVFSPDGHRLAWTSTRTPTVRRRSLWLTGTMPRPERCWDSRAQRHPGHVPTVAAVRPGPAADDRRHHPGRHPVTHQLPGLRGAGRAAHRE